jgi:hypothetical protein
MVVVALGITWVLDGLEVTIVGALSGVLPGNRTAHYTEDDRPECQLLGSESVARKGR